MRALVLTVLLCGCFTGQGENAPPEDQPAAGMAAPEYIWVGGTRFEKPTEPIFWECRCTEIRMPPPNDDEFPEMRESIYFEYCALEDPIDRAWAEHAIPCSMPEETGSYAYPTRCIRCDSTCTIKFPKACGEERQL